MKRQARCCARSIGEIGASRRAFVHCRADFFEFWAVATRPTANNGLGLTISQVTREVANFGAAFEVLPELPLLDEWQRLVINYSMSGKPTHDARYVAALKVHHHGNILTFNGSDFARFAMGESIDIVEPMKV